ncbi:2-hydroxy-3-oxopropionate reductase [candidate division KSB1 bacterium]|nr:2-hydroxy-3-oxopropionate reductase [candidate division KSB1 bacterium]
MEKIGFIGLGIMGNPMSKNLINAGYSLTVYDINKESVSDVVKAGATAAKTCKEVAEQSEVVITMVPDSPEVEEVVYGEQGVLEGVKSGMLFIDMSTIAPATSQKVYQSLQEKGVEALDAPVSGGQVGAEAGTLSIMVGGSDAAFKRALPILEVMGKNIVHIGDAGAGQVTKACNQVVVGMTIQAVAEALTLAKKSGVNVEKVREALLGGFAQSRILDLHGQRVIDRNFEPGFKVKLHRKDMNIALQTGRDLSVPLHGSAIVAAQMDALLAQGDGELDHSALVLLLEQMANVAEK